MPINSTGKLQGQTVLVTRPAPPAGQKDKLVNMLELAGASVIAHPSIELISVSTDDVRKQLEKLDQFKSIAFVSVSGVRFLLSILNELSLDIVSKLSELQIAAIGKGTATELNSHGLTVDFVPDRADSHALGTGLARQLAEPFLIIRANRGSNTLAQLLTQADKQFSELVVYESRDIEVANPEVVNLLNVKQIDWVTLTSPAIAKATISLFGSALKNTRLVSISSSVTNIALDDGFTIAAEAADPGFRFLVEAMLAAAK